MDGRLGVGGPGVLALESTHFDRIVTGAGDVADYAGPYVLGQEEEAPLVVSLGGAGPDHLAAAYAAATALAG